MSFGALVTVVAQHDRGERDEDTGAVGHDGSADIWGKPGVPAPLGTYKGFLG
jgi:hypothetical protein